MIERARDRVAAALLLLALSACTDRRDEVVTTAPTVSTPSPSTTALAHPETVVAAHYSAMGTSVDMRVWTDREPAARAAMDDAYREIKRIEAMMTTWNDTSEVAKINAAAGSATPVPISQELVDVLEGSRRIHDASDGVFDISFYALKGLWHFDQDAAQTIPTDAEIAARLPLVNGALVEVDEAKKTARLPKKGMAINLGGIAKGYAVDRAGDVLRKNGFSSMVVQAGGDLLVRGRKGSDPWKVGIRDPRGAADDFFALAPITDAAFSTAGDYERGFVKDGVRYHHILDPRTGKPASACRSVTIFAPDAFTADELDDAVFILGPEKGMKLVADHPGAGAVIVDKDNNVTISDNLKGVVQIVHAPTPGI